MLLQTDEFFQGDQIGHFLPIGLLLKAHNDFLRRQSSPTNVNILGYFLQKANFYIFTRISSFKTWLVVAIFRFQNLFDVDVFDFQIDLWCGYFGIFSSATVLATFPNIWQYFFQTIRSHWSFSDEKKRNTWNVSHLAESKKTEWEQEP